MAAMSAADVAHLLRRAGFGGSPAEVAAYTGQDTAAVVTQVLDIAANPPEARPALMDQTGPNEERWKRLTALRGYWYDRMAFSPYDGAEPAGNSVAVVRRTDVHKDSQVPGRSGCCPGGRCRLEFRSSRSSTR